MRERAEILAEGLAATKKPLTHPETAIILRLLTLEALVDIRDHLGSTATDIPPGTMDQDERD